MVSALVRLADPDDGTTSECCAAALYLLFYHQDVLVLINGSEVRLVAFAFVKPPDHDERDRGKHTIGRTVEIVAGLNQLNGASGRRSRTSVRFST